MVKNRISVSIDGENFFLVVIYNERVIRNPTKEDRIGTKPKCYNETNICSRCREEYEREGKELTDKSILYPGNAYREYNEKGNWTRNWLCERHNSINRQKLYNSQHNIDKSLRDHRIGNLDPYSETAKGKRSQELACILYGWENLNEKYDNYITPIDCYDPKTGLYHQIGGRYYNSIYKWWGFTGFEREWRKTFVTMVCFCFSEDGKTVERIYKFPDDVIKNQKSISIFKFDSKGNIYNYGWYNKYRCTDEEELKKANYIYRKILESKN